jgi:hypothetical protein
MYLTLEEQENDDDYKFQVWSQAWSLQRKTLFLDVILFEQAFLNLNEHQSVLVLLVRRWNKILL